jgi:hypothetical protein
MVRISTLLAFSGVVAVAFECEVAALVLLGLAVGLAWYLAWVHEGACGEHVGTRREMSLLFRRNSIFGDQWFAISKFPVNPRLLLGCTRPCLA